MRRDLHPCNWSIVCCVQTSGTWNDCGVSFSGSTMYVGMVLPLCPLVPGRISGRSNRTRSRPKSSSDFRVPQCRVEGLSDLRRFVLVLCDLPISFQDHINTVILHKRIVHDDLRCSPALASELSQKPSSLPTRLPATVEDHVSIVDKCTPVSALRNLEVGPVQTVVPLPCPHQLVPIAPPWFVPRRAPLPTVDLPSQNLSLNQQDRDTATYSPTRTQDKIVVVAKVQIISLKSSSTVVPLPPTNQLTRLNTVNDEV